MRRWPVQKKLRRPIYNHRGAVAHRAWHTAHNFAGALTRPLDVQALRSSIRGTEVIKCEVSKWTRGRHVYEDRKTTEQIARIEKATGPGGNVR